MHVTFRGHHQQTANLLIEKTANLYRVKLCTFPLLLPLLRSCLVQIPFAVRSFWGCSGWNSSYLSFICGSTPHVVADDRWCGDESMNSGDFGLSEIKPKERAWLQDPKNGAKGTPLFMPPEVMMGQPFDEKSDVYRYPTQPTVDVVVRGLGR
jgi:serine/threonine protein kinase